VSVKLFEHCSRTGGRAEEVKIESACCLHRFDGAKDVRPALEIHRRIRRLVREEAAKLG